MGKLGLETSGFGLSLPELISNIPYDNRCCLKDLAEAVEQSVWRAPTICPGRAIGLLSRNQHGFNLISVRSRVLLLLHSVLC
jgi:hypothetical protein